MFDKKGGLGRLFVCPFVMSLSKDEFLIYFFRFVTKFAGGSPAASHFLLVRQERVTKVQIRRGCRLQVTFFCFAKRK